MFSKFTKGMGSVLNFSRNLVLNFPCEKWNAPCYNSEVARQARPVIAAVDHFLDMADNNECHDCLTNILDITYKQ